MKVYYAHAICTYGSVQEREEVAHIKKNFPQCTIVDPGSFENAKDKARGGMEFCKKLVSGCDALVFSKLMDTITAGVGIEINHAISQKIPVFELKASKLHPVKDAVDFISRAKTIALYGVWRMNNLHVS